MYFFIIIFIHTNKYQNNSNIAISIATAAKSQHWLHTLSLFLDRYIYIYFCVCIYIHTVSDGLCPDDVKQVIRLWEVCQEEDKHHHVCFTASLTPSLEEVHVGS